jgi:methyl-accepting chemotaxis protein
MDKSMITKAIGAHGMWKNRLNDAMDTGKSEFTPERVAPDNLCDFGKWLYSLPAGDRGSEHGAKVQRLHAAFHKEAAAVLRLCLAGQKQNAQKSMAAGGAYAQTSADLTYAMTDWMNSLEKK